MRYFKAKIKNDSIFRVVIFINHTLLLQVFNLEKVNGKED